MCLNMALKLPFIYLKVPSFTSLFVCVCARVCPLPCLPEQVVKIDLGVVDLSY